MTRKHADKLARRVARLEDRHRRDMIALRNEVFGIVAKAAVDETYDEAVTRRVWQYGSKGASCQFCYGLNNRQLGPDHTFDDHPKIVLE